MNDFYNYESPISVFIQEIREKQDEAIYDSIKYACEEKYLVDVPDKDELIKCLKYDRDQYEKGFKDGQKSISIENILGDSELRKLVYILRGARHSAMTDDERVVIESICKKLDVIHLVY